MTDLNSSTPAVNSLGKTTATLAGSLPNSLPAAEGPPQAAAPELIASPAVALLSPLHTLQPTVALDRHSQSDPIELHSLDPAFVTVERIGGWIFSGVLLTAGLIALAVVVFNFGFLNWVSGCSFIAYVVIGAGLSWLTHVLPKKQHKHAGWCLTHNGLEIRHGIWWRNQISVPLARVQHTDVHQGPLMRRFGLAKLTIHTAGTENSAVALNGLNFEVAMRLRDALVESRGEIDGV